MKSNPKKRKNGGVFFLICMPICLLFSNLGYAQEAVNAQITQHFRDGKAKYDAGQYPEAISSYDSALNLKGVDSIYLNLAAAYYLNGDYGKAIDAINSGLSLKPINTGPYLKLRGETYYFLNNIDAAIADYDDIIEVESDCVPCFINRGKYKTDIGEFDDAIADFTQAISLSDTSSVAYYQRANSKFIVQDFEGALEDAEKSIALNSKNSSSFFTKDRRS